MTSLLSKSANQKLTELCECGSSDIHYDKTRGEKTCRQCGLVLESNVTPKGQWWKVYNRLDNKAICNGPPTYDLSNVLPPTVIDHRNVDAKGKPLTTRRRAQLIRLRRQQRWSQTNVTSSRSYRAALSELARLSSQLRLSKSVKETATKIYHKAATLKMSWGRSTDAIVAASIYAACRIQQVPRTLTEITSCTRVTRRHLAKCVRSVIRMLGTPIPAANPSSFIPRFCNNLELSETTQKYATMLINQLVSNHFIIGKDPTALAAAVIYISGIVNSEKRTQKEVAEVTNVTLTTIRVRSKEILKKLQLEFPVNKTKEEMLSELEILSMANNP